MARPIILMFGGVILFMAAFTLVGPAHAQQDGAMAVDCEGNTPELDTECRFGEGQEFSLGVQIVSPPEGGYGAFQVKLRWDARILEYRPTDEPAEEAVWPHCVIPVREVNLAFEQPGGALAFGCVPFPIPDPSERFAETGVVLLFTFVCMGEGTSEIVLVPRKGEGSPTDPFATVFITPGAPPNLLEILDPSLSPASVSCGGGAVSRPMPEITRGVTPLPSPTAAPPPTPRAFSPPAELSPPAAYVGPPAIGGGPRGALPAAGSFGQGSEDGLLVGLLAAALAGTALAAVAGVAFYLRPRQR